MNLDDPDVIKKRLLENLARKRSKQSSSAEISENKSIDQKLNEDDNISNNTTITTANDTFKSNEEEYVKSEQVKSTNNEENPNQEDDQTSLEEGEIVDSDNDNEEEDSNSNLRQNLSRRNFVDDANRSFSFRKKFRRDRYPSKQRFNFNQPVPYRVDSNYMPYNSNFNVPQYMPSFPPPYPINYFPQEFINNPIQLSNFGLINPEGHQQVYSYLPTNSEQPIFNQFQNENIQEYIESLKNQVSHQPPYNQERMSDESDEFDIGPRINASNEKYVENNETIMMNNNNPVSDEAPMDIEEEDNLAKTPYNKYHLVIDMSESEETESGSDSERSSKQEKQSLSITEDKVNLEKNERKRKIDQVSNEVLADSISLKKPNLNEDVKKALADSNLIKEIKNSIQKRKLDLNNLYEQQEKFKYQLIAHQKSLKKISLERHELEVQLGIIKEFLNQTNYKLKTLRSKEYESNRFIGFTENNIKRLEKTIQSTQDILDSEIRSLSRLEIDTKIKEELIKLALSNENENEKLKIETLKQENLLRLERELLKDAYKLIGDRIRKLDSLIMEKTRDITKYIEKYSNKWINFHRMFSKEYLELKMPTSTVKTYESVHDLSKNGVNEKSILSFLKSYRLFEGFNGKFSSLTWSNNIDPFKILCRYESNGVCNDDSCQLQHKRQYTMTENEILKELSSYAPIGTNPKKQEFVKGIVLQRLEKEFSDLMFEDKAKKVVEMLKESYNEELEQSPIFILFNEKKSAIQSLKRKKKVQNQKLKESVNVDVSRNEEMENFIPFTGTLNLVIDNESDLRYFVEKQNKDELSNDFTYEMISSLQHTTDEMWLRSCYQELSNQIKNPKSFKFLKYIDDGAKEKILNILQKGMQKHIDSVILWYLYLYILYLKRKSGKPLSENESDSLRLVPYSPSLLDISSRLYSDLNQRIAYLNSMIDHLMVGEMNESKEYGIFCVYLELLTYKLEVEKIELIDQWIMQNIIPIHYKLSGKFRILIILSYIYLIHSSEVPVQAFRNLALQNQYTPVLVWRKSSECDKVLQLFEHTYEYFEESSLERFILHINCLEFARVNNANINIKHPLEAYPILPCIDGCNILIRSLGEKDNLFERYFQKSNDFMFIYCKLKSLLTSDNINDNIIDQFYSILWDGFKSLYDIELANGDDLSDLIESIFLKILSLSHFRGIHPFSGTLKLKELHPKDSSIQYSSYKYDILPLNESNPFVWLSFYVYSLLSRYQQASYQIDIINHAHYYLHDNNIAYKVFWKEIIEWNTIIDFAYSRTDCLDMNNSLNTFNLFLENFNLNLYLSQLELKLELPSISVDIYKMLNIFKMKDYDILNYILSYVLTFIEKNKHIELCEQLSQHYPDNYELIFYLSRLEYEKKQEYSYINSIKILRNALRSCYRNSDLWIELLRSESKIGSIETLVSISKEAVEKAPLSNKLKVIYEVLLSYDKKLKDL